MKTCVLKIGQDVGRLAVEKMLYLSSPYRKKQKIVVLFFMLVSHYDSSYCCVLSLLLVQQLSLLD
jgi:hypothetical protein